MKQISKVTLKIFGIKMFFMAVSVLLSFFFAWLVKYSAGRVVYALMLSIMYISIIMSETWTMADCDVKGLYNTHINRKKGLCVGLMVAFIYLIGALLFYFYNTMPLLRVWSAPYTMIFSAQPFLWIYILSAIPDVIACYFGYILGEKQINFKERLVDLFKYGKTR